MAKVKCNGMMELNMQDSGFWEELLVKEFSLTLRERYMMELGLMIELMATENTLIQMALITKELGLRIYSTGRVKKAGLIILFSKVNIRKVRNQELDSTDGQMELVMKANGLITKYKAMDFINGLMAGNI